MAGFFKKFASAFVDFDAKSASAEATGESSAALEAELAALEGQPMGTGASGGAGAAAVQLAPVPEVLLPAETQALLSLTPDELFAEAGFTETPASAPRVVKMLAGLAQFPHPQQLAMLRALDAADDSWSETEVTQDAQNRQAALEAHLTRIEQTRQGRLLALDQQAATAQETRVATLAEIDRQIADLMKLREDAITECANAAAGVDREKRELEMAAMDARNRTLAAAQQLGQLVAFFSVGGPPPR
jgi:hypothetical protein